MKAVENEKDTKEKLKNAAKKEFLEKGFESASLRAICKEAGVTTGALYFFFKGKDDLFDSLVSPFCSQIKNMMDAHFQEEKNLFEKDGAIQKVLDGRGFSADKEASHGIITFCYQHKDQVTLLLQKSHGSSYENFVDEIVGYTEKVYTLYLQKISQATGCQIPNEKTIHWVSHVQIYSFIHILTHAADESEAQTMVEPVVNFLTGGFYGMLDKKI